MRLVFFGTPWMAASHLEAIAPNHEILAVVTGPDAPQGRGLEVSAPPVKTLAQKAQIKNIFQPQNLSDPSFGQKLSELKFDLGVVVAYGKILPAFLLSVPRLGFINVHFSLLPKLRGPSPVEYAILEGHDMTGATVFWLDEKMDTGPVLASRETKILPGENAIGLRERLVKLGTELLTEALGMIAAGNVPKIPQDDSQATYSKKLVKTDGVIDWSKPAEVIERQVRAFAIWPRSQTTLDGRKIQILKARAEPSPSQGFAHAPIGITSCTKPPDRCAGFACGKISRVQKPTGFFVECRTGELLVEELRPEGGRPVSAWAFLQGIRKDFKDIILGS